MTSVTLSSGTVDAVNTEINSAGPNHANYLAAYNAIYADIKNQPGVDPGAVSWFSVSRH